MEGSKFSPISPVVVLFKFITCNNVNLCQYYTTMTNSDQLFGHGQNFQFASVSFCQPSFIQSVCIFLF